MEEHVSFSVVTVVRNAVTEIEKTLKSVLSQLNANIEYIVVDGKSSDGTLEIIQGYQDHIAKIISEPDSGIYNAMNKGLGLATGEYVLFMNAGDTFASNHVLSDIEDALQKNVSLPSLIYGNYQRIGTDISSQIVPARHYKKAWYGMFASHQSMFYNVQFLRANDLRYDESYRIAADYKLTLEVIKRSNNILQLPLCFSQFDTNGVSCLNQSLGLSEADRARREVLEMNFLTRKTIIVFQLFARLVRNSHNLSAIYNFLRNR